MKLTKPQKVIALSMLVSALIGVSAAVLAGCAVSDPGRITKFEQHFMDIKTNYVPVVVVQTNVVPITLFQTNTVTVPVTNEVGVQVIRTNVQVVSVIQYETNVVAKTNLEARIQETPNQNAQNVKEVGGAVGNLFGVGGLVSTAIGGLFSVVAMLRSNKNYRTAATIAQNVETIRSFIRQLPDGSVYDQTLTDWMRKHQAEAGVLDQVVNLLGSEVSNPDAQIAAKQISDTIAALQLAPAPAPRADTVPSAAVKVGI